MTRDEAFTIIRAALPENSGGHFTASHVATALDALGLLAYANTAPIGPRFHKPGEEIADISRDTVAAARVVTGDITGEAKITEVNLPPNSVVGPEAEAREQQRAAQSWAATRQRT